MKDVFSKSLYLGGYPNYGYLTGLTAAMIGDIFLGINYFLSGGSGAILQNLGVVGFMFVHILWSVFMYSRGVRYSARSFLLIIPYFAIWLSLIVILYYDLGNLLLFLGVYYGICCTAGCIAGMRYFNKRDLPSLLYLLAGLLLMYSDGSIGFQMFKNLRDSSPHYMELHIMLSYYIAHFFNLAGSTIYLLKSYSMRLSKEKKTII